ncbi:phage portal protein [Sphingomonas sp. BK069]|uniref:phage portal protein n=1 Tax=Sphingomonas sp. BK069 TaxID=2586979 RepID=UPI001614993C|nr:phage portal protein [Sphingomonas sp. BK069]MBB3347654.1 HK97 family phage portal protein [Sphingomonas sp. BK069]
MAWFRKTAPAPAAARPPLARASGIAAPPPPAAWPQGYEAQVRAGYCGNAIAQRAVRLVAESVASAPLACDDDGLRGLIAAPGLLETVAAQLLLHGNAFVQPLRDADGTPAALYPLRPERVSVELGADGWPAAFLYRVGARATRLAPEAVIHLRRFHPLDDHYGLGCLGAAAPAVAIHNAAAAWSKALLDNAARPSGALVYDARDGAALSPDQFRRLRDEMDAGFAGASNAGRPLLLEGGLTWQPLSLTPADMDFAGTKAAAAREIALAFGVPPMLLGLPGDSTHANYAEANRALWRLTVLPLADAILTGLAAGLARWCGDATVRVDLDRVPALAEDRERLWRMAAAADFLTPEEKRAMVDWQ